MFRNKHSCVLVQSEKTFSPCWRHRARGLFKKMYGDHVLAHHSWNGALYCVDVRFNARVGSGLASLSVRIEAYILVFDYVKLLWQCMHMLGC